jgi:P-type Cu2+ transporter
MSTIATPTVPPQEAARCACFHCGLPVPEASSWSVVINGESRRMCCPGCEAVATTIVANGLSDYYTSRTAFSASSATSGAEALVPPELRLYDTPESMDTFVRPGDDAALSTAVFSVEGIRCGACVWLIERRLGLLAGVQSARLNVATEQLHVSWRAEQCKPSDILAALRGLGYVAYPYDPVRHGEQTRKQEKRLFRQVFIAGLSMMQVMMYAVPAYLATDGTLDADMASLMRWASFWLTVPAVFYSALPFFAGAWTNLKARMPGMDVPVALGIAAAFAGSLVNTMSSTGDVYYDSVTMFIFLLLCSRYLETVARRKAGFALEKIQRGLPASASRLISYPASQETETLPAGRLAAGDLILVRPGESIAADCVIVEGSSSIDMSLLTGESVPVSRTVADTLPGGAVNASQPIVARVERAAIDSMLSGLVKLVERAGQDKPRISQWADQLAGWFVGGLLVFAVMVFFAWQWRDPSQAWPIAIAVLVVSCPCALSLATPSALAAATDRLVRQGVLVVQGHVLETLHRCTHVVFDKTGTLTNGKPVLRRVDTFNGNARDWCLQVAATMEQSSAHPLALAILAAAQEANMSTLLVQDLVYTAGDGIEASIDGTRYRLGRGGFVSRLTGWPSVSDSADGEVSTTSVYLGSAGGLMARFELADTLRSDAADVVRQFRAMGKQVILLSGDQQPVCDRIAAQLGIPLALGSCRPEQKLEFVQKLQAQGGVVAMVGDGINDAAVLRAADVSFAMGTGAALAQTHADAVLLSGRISSVADAALAAMQTMNVIRQNLAWATVYNVIAIPAAALGMLNPWLSGIGMSVSSAVVILNALRLRRIRKSRKREPALSTAPIHTKVSTV